MPRRTCLTREGGAISPPPVLTSPMFTTWALGMPLILRRTLAVALAVLSCELVGCADRPAWERAEAKRIETPDRQGWEALSKRPQARRWSGGVTAVASSRPGLPNAGLQLPRVSPNGQWIAFLDAPAPAPGSSSESDSGSRLETSGRDGSASRGGGVSGDAWVTGRGLDLVSLWVREVQDDGLARNLAVGHAAWPTWSPDGSTLVFISHTPDTGCALVLHDLASNTSRRLAVGLSQMLTPAVAPDGRRVAVAGYGALPDASLIFVIDLATGRPTPGPPPTLGGAQLAPRWLDRNTLLFVELDEHGGGLMRWTVGSPAAVPVAPLNLSASVFDAVHLDAGIPQPISPNGKFFAYYASPQDRIELIRLADGLATPLRPGDRAGTWWGNDWFLVANDHAQQLALVAPPEAPPEAPPKVLSETSSEALSAVGSEKLPAAAETSGAAASGEVLHDKRGGAALTSGLGAADERPRMNLLSGRWAPLWADPAEHSMLLVGPAPTLAPAPGNIAAAGDASQTRSRKPRFNVLQLWVITRD